MRKHLLLFFFFFSFSSMGVGKLDYSNFGNIPILSEGRVKPLDTFARVNLLLFYEKSSLKDMSAIEWLGELIFSNDDAFSRKIFRIRNIDVIKALNIKKDDSGVYSFYEISFALKKILPMISQLYEKEPNLRTPSQGQLVSLYSKVMHYVEIARSLSLLKADFEMPTLSIAESLKLPFKKRLTYIDLYKRQTFIYSEIESINKKKEKNLREKFIVFLGKRMGKIERDQNTKVFRIVPPHLSRDIEGGWFSPWQALLQGEGSPVTMKLFNLWRDLAQSYLAKNENKWNSLSLEISSLVAEMGNSRINRNKIKLEGMYNKWEFFIKSISFYIIAFILLSFSWIYKGPLLQKISYLFLGIGGLTHLSGLIVRCYIMNRPPVSTLYESIIFVALVSVISAIIYERNKKNGIGLFIGTCLGIILLFISFSYEKEGDSMGMLAAVLNTNFWLATHVVTITIGYGCSFVASLLGHIYLVQKYLSIKNKQLNNDLKSLNKSMNGATLYALFFVVLGTILGGIWADQSWGRFWGWDPKENGAMLICLWLLFIIHGRLSGFFRPLYYAVGLVLTSVIVAVAWFGVNLLNVGLHSYGFTDSIAYNLLYFGLFEFVFAGLILLLIFKSQKNLSL